MPDAARWLVTTANGSVFAVRPPVVPIVQPVPQVPAPQPQPLVPKQPTPEQKVVHAFLNPGGGINPTQVSNTFSVDPPYVIIGCGFAATVNHTTLLQTQWGLDRVGTKRIIHVGYPDPWRNYHPHNMNQEIELLTLPGYQTQPGSADSIVTDEATERWLHSPRFAAINTEEFIQVARESRRSGPRPKVIRQYVTDISESGENYKISFFDGSRPLTAAYVDICSGPGQSRAAGRSEKASQELLDEIRALKKPDTNWVPRYITANNITLENAKIAKGGLILVKGSGPAAVQAIERALETAEKADQILWVSKDINGGFPGTMRLDGIVRFKDDGTELPVRTDFPDRNRSLRPAAPTVWLADGYEVASIEIITNRLAAQNPAWHAPWKKLQRDSIIDGEDNLRPRLLVTFQHASGTGRGSSCLGSVQAQDVTATLCYGIFHQVIAANGVQAGDSKEAGSPYAFAKRLEAGAKILKAVLAGGTKLPVGRRDSRGKVRWLASSGHGNWKTLAKDAHHTKTLDDYQSRLPAQAIINLQGVTVSAVTTAYANRWFRRGEPAGRQRYNTDINTIELGELRYACIQKGVSPDYAEGIMKMRMRRTRPFRSLDTVASAYTYWKDDQNGTTVVSDNDLANVAADAGVRKFLTDAGFDIVYPRGTYLDRRF
ncbi:MAG TPA: hypothetical protein VND19_11670 [Acetobacteraceae bacterium]|nr:hypothetical protein [Acetobacteraceae bacterium]